uniref:Galectin domain-containing protein n=1 Tax=Meloidogyne hapla TaxID=6305 RepID=A0A1I8C2E6_MELHA
MIARYFTSILFILFFVFLICVEANDKNEDENNAQHVFLTDMTTTHHALPYLNADQCMLRPGQKEHGSYGLIFFRPNFYLCDKLLICYPSQLSGNNTRNGIIASIPYRLRDYEQNIVTNSCEVKRKEFCDNAKNKHLCSLGQPASTIWHGIMLSTEYFYNVRVFVTTILLSISKQKLYFQLKYEKTKIILGDDYLFAHEYLSNITKGLYLHKYSGLWTLGLDMLPSEAQRYLHLFVYRDCGCTINVWFKNPTTPDSLIPKSPNISQTIGKGLLFKDKDCTKRYTNKSIHELGTIEDGEKIVRFALWTGNEGKEGTIELFDSKDDALLKIHFNGYLIEFDHHGDKRNKEFSKNLLSIGARIDITIRLSKYYVWALFQSDVFDNFVEKFWPKEWWKGNFLFKSEVKMSIFGDFLMVTPLFIQTLEMEETNYCPDQEYCTKKIIQKELFEKGKPFMCELIFTEDGDNIQTIDTKINDIMLNDTRVINDYQIMAVNRITLEGGIQLLHYNVKDVETLNYPFYRRELKELKNNGTIVCFEGFISVEEKFESNIITFAVSLIHATHIKYDTSSLNVLAIMLSIDPGYYKSLGKNFVYVEGMTNMSFFSLSSDFGDNMEITRPIPIGTGVPIVMLINSHNDYYNISINGGDYIHYPHLVPSWAVNRVEASFI